MAYPLHNNKTRFTKEHNAFLVDNTADMDKPLSYPQRDWITDYINSELSIIALSFTTAYMTVTTALTAASAVINANFSVSGISYLTGKVNMFGGMGVTGPTTFNSNIFADQSIFTSGNIDISPTPGRPWYYRGADTIFTPTPTIIMPQGTNTLYTLGNLKPGERFRVMMIPGVAVGTATFYFTDSVKRWGMFNYGGASTFYPNSSPGTYLSCRFTVTASTKTYEFRFVDGTYVTAEGLYPNSEVTYAIS